MRAVTSADVTAFWAAMMQHFGTERAPLQEASTLLSKLTTNPSAFRSSVTIRNRIYTYYTPGIATVQWPLFEQVANCVHEHHHVLQDRSKPGREFYLEYSSNSTSRAHAEAEAYRCDMVLYWRYLNEALKPVEVAHHLWEYGCKRQDIAMAEHMLLLSMKAVRKGAVPGEACQYAVGWLDCRFGG